MRCAKCDDDILDRLDDIQDRLDVIERAISLEPKGDEVIIRDGAETVDF